MKPVLTARQMKLCDEYAMNQPGCSSQMLMERAAQAAKKVLLSRFAPAHVRVICGTGNNGGDGFALARFLLEDGCSADVCVIGDSTRMSVECGRQAFLYAMADGVTVDAVDAPLPGGESLSDESDELKLILVDAIFGIGLDRPVEGIWMDAIGKINHLRVAHPHTCRVMALDLPSGVSADSGKILGTAVLADVTVTFDQLKRGLLLYPAKLWIGELVTADIGIGVRGLDAYPEEWAVEEEDVRRAMRRDAYSNKGTYGSVVIFAGCRGMSGAATLAARAAYRTGAGLCEVVTDESNRVILQTTVSEAVVTTYDGTAVSGKAIDEACRRADAIVIGCGLGQSEGARLVLERVLKYCSTERRVPLVIDADGLNLLAAEEALWQYVPKAAVLTPHPGEMARLCGCAVSDIVGDLCGRAQALADRRGVVCVLKDACTVVAAGQRLFYPICGNNGMATGGSGDVLAGILGAVLAACRGDFFEDPGLYAAFGSSIHAMAGNFAVRKTGAHGLMASDIADAVGKVLL